MRISLVIPVYNAPQEVTLCLESVAKSLAFQAQTNPALVEVLILDDASAPTTQDLLRGFVQRFPWMQLHLAEKNQGYLANVNKGLELSSGDVKVLLNSDTIIPEQFYQRIIQCFQADASIGVAAPVTSCCSTFSVPMKRGYSVAQMDACIASQAPVYPINIFPDGFCMCLRSSMLEQTGDFDPIYKQGFYEETDLCMRAYKAGWKAVLMDNMFVYHKAHASFLSEDRERLLQGNKKIFEERWAEDFFELRRKYPRDYLKARIYCRVYNRVERFWRKAVRFMAQAIPLRQLRRKVRRMYD